MFIILNDSLEGSGADMLLFLCYIGVFFRVDGRLFLRV
jgi:hypothetical protein